MVSVLALVYTVVFLYFAYKSYNVDIPVEDCTIEQYKYMGYKAGDELVRNINNEN